MCLRADPGPELNTTVFGFHHLERNLVNLSTVVFEASHFLPLLDPHFPYCVPIAMRLAWDVILQKATNSTSIINALSASGDTTSYTFRYLCR